VRWRSVYACALLLLVVYYSVESCVKMEYSMSLQGVVVQFFVSWLARYCKLDVGFFLVEGIMDC
jgi:hypothetical protein